MGLFGKTPTEQPEYNPNRKEIRDLYAGRKIDFDAIRRDIELEGATGERSIRGASKGDAALYSSARTALSNSTQRALSAARLQSDIANTGFRADEARALDVLGQQDVQARNLARGLNLQFQANQAQYIPKGLEQVSGVSQGRYRDDILINALAYAKQQNMDEATRANFFASLGLRDPEKKKEEKTETSPKKFE